MSKLLNQWIDLFRAGDYGDKGTFTDQDVQQVVDNYDPTGGHEAPSTIGHKTTGKPAYGWWSKLRRIGDLLQGQMSEVDPAFAEAVEQKKFKKRSVGLVKGPKGWMLHHVAWLGAEIPHVKGLKDVAFEQEDSALEIEFSEETYMGMDEKDQQSIVDKLVEKMKGIFPSHKPVEGAAAFTEEQQKAAIAEAVAAAVKPVQAALDAQQKVFTDGQTAAQAQASQARADAAIGKLKAGGKWVPAFDAMGVPHLFQELAKVDTAVEFGEEGKKVKQTPLEVLFAFMDAQPKIVQTNRIVDPAAKTGTTQARTFAEGTDQNSIKFNELAEELERTEKISFAEAGRRVAKEHPELLKPGAATAGGV